MSFVVLRKFMQIPVFSWQKGEQRVSDLSKPAHTTEQSRPWTKTELSRIMDGSFLLNYLM